MTPETGPALNGGDPTWFPRVLEVLARDFPTVSRQVWSTAIGENAARLVAIAHGDDA